MLNRLIARREERNFGTKVSVLVFSPPPSLDRWTSGVRGRLIFKSAE